MISQVSISELLRGMQAGEEDGWRVEVILALGKEEVRPSLALTSFFEPEIMHSKP